MHWCRAIRREGGATPSDGVEGRRERGEGKVPLKVDCFKCVACSFLFFLSLFDHSRGSFCPDKYQSLIPIGNTRLSLLPLSVPLQHLNFARTVQTSVETPGNPPPPD